MTNPHTEAPELWWSPRTAAEPRGAILHRTPGGEFEPLAGSHERVTLPPAAVRLVPAPVLAEAHCGSDPDVTRLAYTVVEALAAHPSEPRILDRSDKAASRVAAALARALGAPDLDVLGDRLRALAAMSAADHERGRRP